MCPDAISAQQQPSVLVQAGNPSASPTSKLHVPPWPQSAYSESLKNGHVRGPPSMPKPQDGAQPQLSRGHKRSATGEIKPAVYHHNGRQWPPNGLAGHSRTESLDSTGNNRIAELSAQLRARLSYAAARVEKSRQLRQQGEGYSSQATISDLRDAGGSHRLYNDFPEDGNISAPELSQPNVPSPNGRIGQDRAGTIPRPSSTLEVPKLAPPVDIVTGDRTKPVRRRPNPNEVDGSLPHNSTSRHRRHYSEQEGKIALTATSGRSEVPDASSFTPSRSRSDNRTLTPLVSSNQSPMKRRTPSQNALMEKDAIETLLFMSSPENSGYHSSSLARKSSVSVSIEAQMAASVHESSQGSNRSRPNQIGGFDFLDHEATRTTLPASTASSHSIGLEAQAGDEIDRLLDQMEVDRGSDAESHLMPYGFDVGASEQ